MRPKSNVVSGIDIPVAQPNVQGMSPCLFSVYC